MEIAKKKQLFFENQDRAHEILTIEDVGAWLKVKESFLRALIYQRRIPFFKVGRLIRFRRSDLEHWIAEGSLKDPLIGGQV